MPNKKKLSEDDPQAHHPPHYLHELPLEDEERLEKLFNKLDKDGNGKIDIHDLSEALKEHGIHTHYAEKFLKSSSNASSGDLFLADFIHYVREHEKKLRLHFSHLDRNKDGRIDLDELTKAFSELGIPLEKTEAKKLLSRMDQDGNLNISYDEWRDFLLLAPSHDLHQLIIYWRHSTRRISRMNHVKKSRSVKNHVLVNLNNFNSEFDFSGNSQEAKQNKWLLYTSDKKQKGSDSDESVPSDIPGKVTDQQEDDEVLASHPKSGKSKFATATEIEEALQVYRSQERLNPTKTSGLQFPDVRDYEPRSTFRRARSMFTILEHVTVYIFKYLDIGEDMNIPDDFTQTELQTGMWWRHLAAGGIAGAVSRTCTAPLDRLKVFLQVQTSKQKIGDCFTCMVKEGGFTGLWRGNGINVLKIAPESAIKFAAYEQIKRFIKGDSMKPLSIYERFCAGALAGGVSQTAIYPLEVLKTRLALRKTGQYKSIADAAYKIYATEGLKSFYRGYIPNILGIVPYAGIDLAVYETLKKKYLNSHPSDEQPSFYLLLACGSASSTLGQMCSYPLALIRTRLQAQVVTQTVNPRSATMTGVFKSILEKEGVLGLYRGITPNFIKVMPAVSISYVVYEYSSRMLGVNMT